MEEKLKQQIKLLEEKRHAFSMEKIVTSSASEKFELDFKIKDIEMQLQQLREQLTHLKIPGSIPESSITVHEKLKILFLSASPDDQQKLQTDKEFRIIKEELIKGKMRDDFELLNPGLAITDESLLDELNHEPQILHFAGHGEKEGLVIVDDNNQTQILPAKALSTLFQIGSDPIKLVILNACYSVEQAKVISEQDIFVIGISSTIKDEDALSFTTGFYKYLLKDGTLEEEVIRKALLSGRFLLEARYATAGSLIELWKGGDKLTI